MEDADASLENDNGKKSPLHHRDVITVSRHSDDIINKILS